MDTGFPFQNMMASVRKLAPLSSTLNGTLLEGAAFGDKVAREGGDEENTFVGPILVGACDGFPHPMVKTQQRTNKPAGR